MVTVRAKSRHGGTKSRTYHAYFSTPVGRSKNIIWLSDNAYHIDSLDRSVEIIFSARAELHFADSKGEQSVVSPFLDAGSGDEFRSALANNNIADFHRFAVKFLNAEVFWLRISPVFS